MIKFNLERLIVMIMFSINICFFVSCILAEDSCYVQPGFTGDTCTSTHSTFSSDYATTITYNIHPVSDATEVFCEGLGSAPLKAKADLKERSTYAIGLQDEICTFGWYPIMDGVPILWGSNSGNPAIRCKGVPLGTTISWSWNSGVSDQFTCFNPYKTNEQSDKQSIKLTAITVIIILIAIMITSLLIYHVYQVRKTSYLML